MNIPRPKSRQPIPKRAKKVFTGVIFDVWQWQQKMFDGTAAPFEKIKRADTVCIIPITADKKIIVAEQEQPGKEPFIGLVGGRVDKGEDALSAAKRELLEETGYQSADWTFWRAEQPVSKIDWAIYYFVARGCRKVAPLNLDSGEKIKLKYVSLEEFVELLLAGKLYDKELSPIIAAAKVNKKKMQELKNLLFG